MDTAVLEYLTPSIQLFAHEGIEFFRRTAHRANAGFFQLPGDDGIGIHLDDFALNLVNHQPRRAGGRNQPDPGRDIVERGKAGLRGERLDFG